VVDADYFLSGLPMQVIAYQNAACVRIVTSDNDYLIRNIIRTYADSVTLNVWLDAKGLAPISAASSSRHEFDVGLPSEYKGVTIPFEQILEVVVVPARQPHGRFSFQ
jgi:vacuolar-type H+-ATPase catalytic subunit A/Vma1